MNFLPADLRTYLSESVPFPYEEPEYQALFGYLRICRTLKYKGATRLIPRRPGRGWEIPHPPALEGLPAGFLRESEYSDYEDEEFEHYKHPSSAVLIPQMLVCLTSYSEFTWSQVSKVLFFTKHKGDILAAARTAASLGNFPLTCKLIKRIKIYQDSRFDALALVRVASPNRHFSRKLRQAFPDDENNNFGEAIRDLLRGDKVDVYQDICADYKATSILSHLDQTMITLMGSKEILEHMRHEKEKLGKVAEHVEQSCKSWGRQTPQG